MYPSQDSFREGFDAFCEKRHVAPHALFSGILKKFRSRSCVGGSTRQLGKKRTAGYNDKLGY